MTYPLSRSLIVVAALAAPLLASEPRIASMTPHGGPRGTEVTLEFRGNRLADVEEIHLYKPGITVTGIEQIKDKKGAVIDNTFKATLKIAADAQIGEHQLRVRTKTGWTFSQNFYVGTLPTVMEGPDASLKQNNNSVEMAEKIKSDVTIEGVIQNEDVDFYAIELKKNQRLTIEVEGIRLGTAMFDPTVVVLDSEKFEVARSDDSALLKQDPSLSFLAPTEGTYYIKIHDGEYGGGGSFFYRMHVGDLPRPTAIYPAGGQIGESLQATFLGDKRGPIPVTLKLSDKPETMAAVAKQGEKYAPSPNWVRVSPFPNVLENEPNDETKQVSKAAAAPVAFNGIIQKPGDVDYFRFSAKKGQALDVQAFARTLRTPLDPQMTIHNEKGNAIASNDDSGGELDSYVRFRVPADGEYYVSIKDQLGRGGEDFVYRIEIAENQPSVRFSIPEVSRRDTQTRQWIAVPQGGRAVVRMLAKRSDFSGELKLMAENLPKGVKMIAPNVAENASDIAVIFEAEKDAPIGGTLADIKTSTVDEKKNVHGRFIQTADLVRGNPNGTSYYAIELPRLPVAVVEEAPFNVELIQPKVPLVQSGAMKLKIKTDKAADLSVNAYMVTMPAGVSGQSRITIEKGKNEGELAINASKGAAVGKWPVAVEVFGASKSGGDAYISTQHITLEIAPPLVDGKIHFTTVEAGKTAEMEVDLQQRTPFEGKAKLELLGLPAKATAEPVYVTSADTKAVFKVTADAGTPVGQHKSLVVQVTKDMGEEAIVQNFGLGGVLRVDRPAGAADANEAKKPAPAPAKKNPAKK